MSERSYIGRGEMQNLISQSVTERPLTENENPELSAEEQAVLDEILDTIPAHLTDREVGGWCRREADRILRNHPELQNKALEIRNNALKEIRYKLDKNKYFTPIFEAIKEKGVKEINYNWISVNVKPNGPSILASIKVRYATLDGKPDHAFIAKKLEEEGITFTHGEQSNWQENPKKLISERLVTILEKLKEGETVNVKDIIKLDSGLYAAITKYYPVKDKPRAFNLNLCQKHLIKNHPMNTDFLHQKFLYSKLNGGLLQMLLKLSPYSNMKMIKC
jgi:hypothetical protein